LKELSNPEGKARRWDGKVFNAVYDGIGSPVASLQIPRSDGGGAASSPVSMFHWGPSVSWNTYLQCWVMLMARSEGPSWKGSSLFISFNPNADLGKGDNSQKWSKPELLYELPGFTLWYPSLQPLNTQEDLAAKNTCLKLGKQARLFFKSMKGERSEYSSSFIVEFSR
jgi:hypothetical protein